MEYILGYTLVRNHAIVYDDVNRLVPSCTGPFQVYWILREIFNIPLYTALNRHKTVTGTYQFIPVHNAWFSRSLRILYTWNGPVQDGTRRFTSSYTIAWFRTRVYTEDVLHCPKRRGSTLIIWWLYVYVMVCTITYRSYNEYSSIYAYISV